jgi:hypothetical protein
MVFKESLDCGLVEQDISGLDNGIYILSLNDGFNRITQKIILNN